MTYALVTAGAVARHPYTLEQFRRDNPAIELADDASLADLEEYGVLDVAEVPPPAITEGQTLDLDTPVLVDGRPQQNWIVHDWLTMTDSGLYARIVDNAVAAYPFTPARLRSEIEGSWPRSGPIMLMDGQHGIVEVATSAPPAVTTEQIVDEVDPVFENGAWRQAWAVRDRTTDELSAAKAALRAAVGAKLAAVFTAGFTPASGPLAGKTLQTRDMDDRTNWLTSQAAYSAAVAAGQGAVEGAVFRTAANETIVTTYQDGLLTLLAMAGWGKAVMGYSWGLKDAIEAAATFGALDLIDIDAGWPA